MGFALDKLGDAECLTIAQGLFKVTKVRGAKAQGLCPFHEEKTPSFYYDSARDSYGCSVCGIFGDLIKLWCHAFGLDSKGDGFKAFCREHGITGKGGPGTKRRERPVPVEKPKPIWTRRAPKG